ncbi:ABC-F family ATP-binding cassette domain-containing protein [Oscillibacter valericigenes]|uniref:ABC-F family ATP-binding cassette domain-containing protein n=1 Tax=Oscillibacter valericigenes TaxID=351091 RepID=UPI001F2DACF4|nr:ABC-F family ATP-binding cassette domain-containing protein [Oscillibacter valericigenes]MCF2617758.1 ABC-F family ATP-binding cassette domain-containing protein [Oscillibacter valericigenes]
MLLSAEHISINFGSRQLLEDVNFYLNEGDKTGIIGINGTGKSTFLKVLAGAIEPDAGRISRNPNVQVSYLPQNPVMDDDATVLEQVFLHFPAEFRALNEYEAKTMLNKLGLPDFEQKVGTLSGGQRKRVALAAALIHPADVLVLDEPTNHLDAEMTAWLEDWLRKFKGGLVMVTHDRYFLERVVNHITELSRGKLYHYEANYSKYLELKEQRAEMAEASERKRQSILRVEREWIMRGCKARTTKSKERIQRYEALLNQDAPETDDTVQMAAASSRLGKKIIELKNVSKSFGGRPIVEHFSYNLLRNDRIGIVGRNGAGKSTLLHLIAGELAPDSGSVDIGATVKIGHFSQEGRELDLNQRVYDFIHDIADEVRTDEGTFTANQMMERFLFPGDLQSVPIGRLSGGERRRLYLLSVLMEAPNVLLLDEPTNDLDVMTLSILEDYLQGFPGPILVVSHDRFLLDKLAESIMEVRDGQILRYTGNWTDWQQKRREEETPVKAEKPKAAAERPRERKLKFSYKEQLEFETIDDELAALENQLAECQAAQGQCGSDYVKLQELQTQQEELEARLEEKTERWVYLNELKEKIDAQ